MNKIIKEAIKANKPLRTLCRKLRFYSWAPRHWKLYQATLHALRSRDRRPCVYYIGIPAHTNLGDLAQGVCIRRWIGRHYPDHQLIGIETNALVNTLFSAQSELRKAFDSSRDIIIFQSGYTTTDLGGYADEMHRAVINLLSEARMLMMPQTIFFESESRRKLTEQVYNRAAHMLFLARDRVSFGMAKEMFPDLPVLLYPDIVTSLIGQHQYTHPRDGIMFCCRDDSEKFYSDEEIGKLMQACEQFARVERTDTTKHTNAADIVRHAKEHVMAEIERYSRYKLMITDRYHGTIFSLVAGTPVIIIKTTDHKVTTGAEWFRGVYDDYVHLADSLEDALQLARELYTRELSHRLEPHFEREYYDHLPSLFQENTQPHS